LSDRNDFSKQTADLLRGQDRLNTQMEEFRKENKENTDRTITAFNNFADNLLKKLDSVDEQLVRLPIWTKD
jgi:hypothetical protein